MRKYEISCTIIIQALSQLKAMYKDEWEVIVGNCDSLLFLGGSDKTTLEYISGKLGKQTIRSVNNSRSYGRQGSYSMSYNKDGRELMTQDELSNMDNINCILFIRGLYPFFTTKYDLEAHPNYNLTGDARKDLKFDVKKMLNTGEAVLKQSDENKAVRMVKEAEIADSLPAERQHRFNNRPPIERTKNGKTCLKVEPFQDMIPHFAVPTERLTPEQQAEQQEVLNVLDVESVHLPKDKETRAQDFSEIRDQFILDNYGYGDEGEEVSHEEK